MAQPDPYNRATDFTEQSGDETDHAALNAELDGAALSINQIRTNLAKIQKDDGSLKNETVGLEQLKPDLRNGIPGPTGPQGATGPQGMQGLQGVTGPTGPQGMVGERGPAGVAGPQGPQGTQGTQGVKGDTGATGPTGPQGPQGEQGIQGLTGSQGPIGPQGPQGIQGVAGMSFDVDAVGVYADRANYNSEPHGFAFLSTDNGFLYLRLGNTPGVWSGGVPFGKGEKGDQGIQGPVGPLGPVGPIGPQGPQGMQGETGPQGATGATGAQGPQGLQGPQGIQGPQGAKGMNWKGQWYSTTAYVVDDAVQHNGSGWVALQASTNIEPSDAATTQWSKLVSKGETGPVGPMGPTGSTGPVGPAGPQGPNGPQGPTGPAGPQGLTGPTGLTGAQGPQGPTGPQGPAGDVTSRVAKSGDTMSGTLTVPELVVSSTAPYLRMQDTDWGNRWLHSNSGTMGHLDSAGNWNAYDNNSGQVWTKNYGWLHDYFFSSVANCAYTDVRGNGNTGNCVPGVPINCYGGGNLYTTVAEVLDNGSQVQLRSVRYNYNCNCNCDCCCCFAPGTAVCMADGSTKLIEDIQCGELVLGLREEPVVVAHKLETALKTNALFLVNGELRVTGGHLFQTAAGWAAIDMAGYPAGVFFRAHQAFANGELVDVAHSHDHPEPVRALEVGDVVNGVPIRSIERLDADVDFTVHNLVVEGSDGFILAGGYAVDGFLRHACGECK